MWFTDLETQQKWKSRNPPQTNEITDSGDRPSNLFLTSPPGEGLFILGLTWTYKCTSGFSSLKVASFQRDTDIGFGEGKSTRSRRAGNGKDTWGTMEEALTTVCYSSPNKLYLFNSIRARKQSKTKLCSIHILKKLSKTLGSRSLGFESLLCHLEIGMILGKWLKFLKVSVFSSVKWRQILWELNELRQ